MPINKQTPKGKAAPKAWKTVKPQPPEPTDKAEKRIIDWETLAVHYRAGIRSLKDMGAEFGVSDAAIIKKARKAGWTRDLKGKIKAKADKLVSAALVSAEVSERTEITEKLTIEVEAQVQSRIILSHRRDIPAARSLTTKMFRELELQTDGIELLQELGELMRQENERGQDKLNDLYHKVIGLSGRSSTLKSLVDSLKSLVALEREAFGLDDTKTDSSADSWAEFLTDLSARGSRLPTGAKA